MTCEALRQMPLQCVCCSIARTVRVRAWQLCSIYLITWATFEAVLPLLLCLSVFLFLSIEDHILDWACHFKGLFRCMEKHHGDSVNLAFAMKLSRGFRSVFPCGAPEKYLLGPPDWLRHRRCSYLSKDRASPLPTVRPCYAPGQEG